MRKYHSQKKSAMPHHATRDGCDLGISRSGASTSAVGHDVMYTCIHA